jgi:hypothetical protein
VGAEAGAHGRIVDRRSHELLVSGSPAQAIREHFSATRADLDSAASMITLVDPAGAWASAVIKALADAGGRPVERLSLREQATLRTLATIERTTLTRRHDDTLRIYHAEVRAGGAENAEIPVALMERSQLTTVIVGPLDPEAVDAMLDALRHATRRPLWRCPHLLFMLPPNASWIAARIDAVDWPGPLHTHVLSEPMSGASAVWNAMLGLWNRVKGQPGWDEADTIPMEDEVGEPVAQKQPQLETIHVVPDAAPPREHAPAGAWWHEAPDEAPEDTHGGIAHRAASRAALDPTRAHRALAATHGLEGLLGCAVVETATGRVIARETRSAAQAHLDMDVAAAASARALRAHRHAARQMGLAEPVEELMTSAGARQQVMRTLARHPGLFIVALFDRHRTNLAQARLQLMEVEYALL